MISEVYFTFRKAGVPEEDARLAADVLSEEGLQAKMILGNLIKSC